MQKHTFFSSLSIFFGPDQNEAEEELDQLEKSDLSHFWKQEKSIQPIFFFSPKIDLMIVWSELDQQEKN